MVDIQRTGIVCKNLKMDWSLMLLGVFSFGISFLSIPIVIRSVGHQKGVPPMGGIAIFGTLAVFFISPFSSSDNASLIFGVLAILFVVALLDDLRPMSAKWRLVLEFGLFTYLIILGGYRWMSIDYEEWGFAAILLELFVVVLLYLFLVNAFNFIDGINGLASIFVLSIASICGWWFYKVGNDFYANLAFVLSGSILGFLPFNWGRAKIYLGDSGILISSLLLCILLSKMVQTNELLQIQDPIRMRNPYMFILGMVFFPAFDAVRVIITRICKNKSPLAGDKSHLHYELMFRLGSPKRVVLILLALSISTFSYLIMAQKVLKDTVVVLTAIIFWVLMTQWFFWKFPLRKKRQSRIS
jgi:UDP-GlcNAc:undecaprenyl-phosphate GlcNAc-1-phosphate transferase